MTPLQGHKSTRAHELAQLYAHFPLTKPRSIRVLDLHPSRSTSSPLRGTLRVISLSGLHSYSTLSYTWGSPPPPPPPSSSTATPWVHHITVSSTPLPLTQNCHQALTHLRRPFTGLTIWVDAICIHQADTREKDAQVALMKEVYGAASTTYVWLGEGNELSEYAMRWARDVTRDISPLEGVQFASFPHNLRVSSQVYIAPTTTARVSSKAMNELARREWFSGMWPIQEVAMAHNAIVVCGWQRIRWNNLFDAILQASSIQGQSWTWDGWHSLITTTGLWLKLVQKVKVADRNDSLWGWRGPLGTTSTTPLEHFFDFMESHGEDILRGTLGVLCSYALIRYFLGFRPFNSLIHFPLEVMCFGALFLTPPGRRDGSWEAVSKGLLRSWLHETRKRRSSKAKDKVFALYGVLRDLGMPLDAPNYEKDVAQVYTEFTRSVIAFGRSLDVLVEAGWPWIVQGADADDGDVHLPSWVPDWSRSHHTIAKILCEAAGDSVPWYEFDTAGIRISTRGVSVDRITSCSSELEVLDVELLDRLHANPDPSLPLALVNNVQIFRDWISSVQINFSHILQHPLRQSFFDVLHCRVNIQNEYLARIKQHFDQWYTLLMSDFSGLELGQSSYLAIARAICADEALARYHHHRCHELAGHTCFFLTENGYVGLGSSAVTVGDQLVLLTGLAWPFVLRGDKREREYRVIGSAHVHGIMKGEKWPAKEEALETLTLV